MHVLNDSEERYIRVLGSAVLETWSDLSQGMQQLIFEKAVVLGHQTVADESLREQLAKFLHEHHDRTNYD